jgi:phosphatidyl-myo-inositol alpha-mannosyltransferase
MKICLVSPYDFAREGGVNQHILTLAEEFRARGHIVKIMAPWSESEDAAARAYPDLYPVGNIAPIKANGSVARITLSLNLSGKVRRILQHEQFDVIHYHEPLMPALPLTVLAGSHTVNIGTFHAFAQSNIGYYYGRYVLRYFTNKLDGRIAVSVPARNFISQYFPGDYTIVPNPINFGRFSKPVQPLEQFSDGKLNIIFVGRFGERRKGFRFLLKAFQYVQQQMPNSRLIVVGKGDTRGYMRYIRHHNIQNVVFTGFVPDDDLPRYYQSGHAFCAPSTGGESFGIVLVEAMASGLPVVASDIPGYASVLEHGKQGLLVEPKNVEVLAMALIRVLSDNNLRRQMSDSGREKAPLYGRAVVAEKVLSMYERSKTRREARARLKRIQHARRANRNYYGLGWMLRRTRRKVGNPDETGGDQSYGVRRH